MSIIVKDANALDKYFQTIGVGDITSPFLSIPSDFYTEVRKGNVYGHSIVSKFGAIAGLTTTLTPITSSGTYPTPTTPVALELVSTDNTNDIPGGTGALSVTIEGISNTNGVWTEESQTVALNGTTAVAVPNSMLRVYRLYVATSGSYATQTVPSHNSTITLRVASAGATWQQLTPTATGSFGLAQSEIACYTVAKGQTGYLLNKKITIESTKSANVFLFVRDNADTVAAPFSPMRVKELDRNIVTSAERHPAAPIVKVAGPADIGFMGQSTSVTTNLSIEFEILLVDD